MGERWVVGVGDRAFEAEGHRSRRVAFKHVTKHFLKDKERWGQLCSDAEIEAFRSELEQAIESHGRISKETNAVLERALARYEAVVRLESTGEKVENTRAYLYEPRDGDKTHRNIGVVCAAGVLAIFREAAVSHLDTAYRPTCDGKAWPKSRREFVDAALNKLAELVSDGEALERSR